MSNATATIKTPGQLVFVIIFTFFLGGLIFMWYNHVWFQKDIPFWKLGLLSLPYIWFANVSQPFKVVAGLIFASTLIAQVAKWLGLLLLPIIG